MRPGGVGSEVADDTRRGDCGWGRGSRVSSGRGVQGCGGKGRGRLGALWPCLLCAGGGGHLSSVGAGEWWGQGRGGGARLIESGDDGGQLLDLLLGELREERLYIAGGNTWSHGGGH